MQTDRVGKYRIIAKLGQGGMASVFLSVVPGHAGFNKLLVVKLLKEDLAQDADFLAMFLNEARLAARLNHANVVQTYEIGVDGAVHFLAMDYLDGQPLHTVIRKAARAKMPLDVHLRILADTLAGLHYAHTLKDFDGTPLLVVHRDVSPQNVFVTYDGQVKLVDFGIAKAAGAASTTQHGVFKGKLAYVAPEQAGGEPVDARADLFSVGVMLWEAIAGQRFAQGDGATAVLARRLSGKEPRIRQVVPDVDPALADICDRAMAPQPGDRFESAEAFRYALEAYLDRGGRRVGSREVGELMVVLFAEEREKIRQIIDAQMKRLLRETATALSLPSLDIFPGAMDPTPITTIEGRAVAERAAQALRDQRSVSAPPESGAGSPTGTNPTLVAANISQAPPPARSTGRTALIGLAVVALALMGGLVLVLSLKSPPPPKVATPADGAVAERIKLSISFGPPGVVAKLDGVPLAESPFVAQVPRDGSMHRLDVQGAGLRSDTRMVSYDRDLLVTVSLATAEPRAEAAASAAPTASPVDPAKRSPGDAPARPRTPKPAREIDEKDPYKK